jgi:hypothetical protein
MHWALIACQGRRLGLARESDGNLEEDGVIGQKISATMVRRPLVTIKLLRGIRLAREKTR